jgi:hypothetical protein
MVSLGYLAGRILTEVSVREACLQVLPKSRISKPSLIAQNEQSAKLVCSELIEYKSHPQVVHPNEVPGARSSSALAPPLLRPGAIQAGPL